MDTQGARLGRLEHLVDARIRHRHGHVDQGRGDVAERLEGRLARGRVAVVDEHDRERHRSDQLGRDERGGRERHQERDRRQLLGRARGDRHEAAQDVAGGRHEQRATEDLAGRVELELEPRDDTEVAAAAADRPEQVGMRVRARGDLPAVGRHDLDRLEGVDRQAVLADQPADPAAEGEPGDADRPGVAERGGQTVGRRGDRVFLGRQTGLGPRDPALGIDVEALHGAEVEHDPAVVGAVAGEAVAAAADRQGQPRLACQVDRAGDVGRVGRANDERRTLVGPGAVHLPRQVVLGAAGEHDRAAQTGLEGVEVERVVVAGGAEGFHASAPWRWGCLEVAWAIVESGPCPTLPTRVPHRHGHPTTSPARRAWRAGGQRAGRVSRMRVATRSPEPAVRTATTTIAARGSTLSATRPTRIAPMAKPRSRQKR